MFLPTVNPNNFQSLAFEQFLNFIPKTPLDVFKEFAYFLLVDIFLFALFTIFVFLLFLQKGSAGGQKQKDCVSPTPICSSLI